MSINKPSTKLEEWRYADSAALGSLAAEAFDEWQEITVNQGHTHRHCVVLDGSSPLLQRLRIKLEANARAEYFAVIAASDYTRLELEVDLAQGAHFEFGGVTIGGGNAVREIVTRTIHNAPDATSKQTVRSVHWGEATGNYLGQIGVGREGQRTDAAQDFKALLLEKGASANAKPELEIFADDVKCAHGAAIGQMDESARFYMASRGLAPDVAKRLLVRAFIADALAALDDEAERERLFEAALASLSEAAL